MSHIREWVHQAAAAQALLGARDKQQEPLQGFEPAWLHVVARVQAQAHTKEAASCKGSRLRLHRDHRIISVELDSSAGVPASSHLVAEEGSSSQAFKVDAVLGPSASQEAVYDVCASRLLSSWFEGYDVGLVACGSAGSGKSHTVAQVLTQLAGVVFEGIATREDAGTRCQCSMQYVLLESDGQVTDLLALQPTEHPGQPAVLQALPATRQPGQPAQAGWRSDSSAPAQLPSRSHTSVVLAVDEGELELQGAQRLVLFSAADTLRAWQRANHALNSVSSRAQVSAQAQAHTQTQAQTASAAQKASTSQGHRNVDSSSVCIAPTGVSGHKLLLLSLQQQTPPCRRSGEVEMLSSQLWLLEVAAGAGQNAAVPGIAAYGTHGDWREILGTVFKEAAGVDQGSASAQGSGSASSSQSCAASHSKRTCLGPGTRLLQTCITSASLITLVSCLKDEEGAISDTLRTLSFSAAMGRVAAATRGIAVDRSNGQQPDLPLLARTEQQVQQSAATHQGIQQPQGPSAGWSKLQQQQQQQQHLVQQAEPGIPPARQTQQDPQTLAQQQQQRQQPPSSSLDAFQFDTRQFQASSAQSPDFSPHLRTASEASSSIDTGSVSTGVIAGFPMLPLTLPKQDDLCTPPPLLPQGHGHSVPLRTQEQVQQWQQQAAAGQLPHHAHSAMPCQACGQAGRPEQQLAQRLAESKVLLQGASGECIRLQARVSELEAAASMSAAEAARAKAAQAGTNEAEVKAETAAEALRVAEARASAAEAGRVEADARTAALVVRVESATRRAAAVEAKLGQAEARCADLEAKVKLSTFRANEAEARQAELSAQCEGLRSGMQAAEARARAAEADAATKSEGLQAADARAKAEALRATRAEAAAAAAKARYDETQAGRQEAEARADAAEAGLKDAEARVTVEAVRATRAEATAAAAEARRNEAQAARQEAEARASAAEAGRAEAEARLKAKEVQKADAEANAKAEAVRATRAEAMAAAAEARRDEAQAASQQVEARARAAEAAMKKAEATAKAEASRATQAEAMAAAASARQGEARVGRQEAEARAVAEDGRAAEAVAQVRAAESRATVAESRAKAAEVGWGEAQARAAAMEARASRAEAALGTAEDKRRAAEARAEGAEARARTAEARCKELEASITALQVQVKVAEGRADLAESKLTETEARATAAEKASAEAQACGMATNDRLVTAEAKVSEAEARAAAATEQLQASQQELQEARQQLASSREELDAARRQLQATEDQLELARDDLQRDEVIFAANMQEVRNLQKLLEASVHAHGGKRAGEQQELSAGLGDGRVQEGAGAPGGKQAGSDCSPSFAPSPTTAAGANNYVAPDGGHQMQHSAASQQVATHASESATHSQPKQAQGMQPVETGALPADQSQAAQHQALQVQYAHAQTGAEQMQAAQIQALQRALDARAVDLARMLQHGQSGPANGSGDVAAAQLEQRVRAAQAQLEALQSALSASQQRQAQSSTTSSVAPSHHHGEGDHPLPWGHTGALDVGSGFHPAAPGNTSEAQVQLIPAVYLTGSHDAHPVDLPTAQTGAAASTLPLCPSNVSRADVHDIWPPASTSQGLWGAGAADLDPNPGHNHRGATSSAISTSSGWAEQVEGRGRWQYRSLSPGPPSTALRPRASAAVTRSTSSPWALKPRGGAPGANSPLPWNSSPKPLPSKSKAAKGGSARPVPNAGGWSPNRMSGAGRLGGSSISGSYAAAPGLAQGFSPGRAGAGQHHSGAAIAARAAMSKSVSPGRVEGQYEGHVAASKGSISLSPGRSAYRSNRTLPASQQRWLNELTDAASSLRLAESQLQDATKQFDSLTAQHAQVAAEKQRLEIRMADRQQQMDITYRQLHAQRQGLLEMLARSEESLAWQGQDGQLRQLQGSQGSEGGGAGAADAGSQRDSVREAVEARRQLRVVDGQLLELAEAGAGGRQFQQLEANAQQLVTKLTTLLLQLDTQLKEAEQRLEARSVQVAALRAEVTALRRRAPPMSSAATAQALLSVVDLMSGPAGVA